MSYSRIVYKGTKFERKVYYKDKELRIRHREDGPACEWVNGDKEWWLNDKLHRIGGPSAQFHSGEKFFAINGIFYEENEYWSIIRFGAFA